MSTCVVKMQRIQRGLSPSFVGVTLFNETLTMGNITVTYPLSLFTSMLPCVY